MPYIKKQFIDALLSEKANIKEVISDYVELKKKGAHYFGLSPFVDEKTPSFCVNSVKQRFTDYSSGKSGNIVSFLMENNQLSYTEAIEEIAKKYNVAVEYENSEIAKEFIKKQLIKEDLRPVLLATLNQYYLHYKSLSNDHDAVKEVEGKRHYTKKTIADWQIGFAPGENFIFNLVKKSKKLVDAKKLGIVGDKYDKYWHRIIYPIHDINGLLVGFAGRDIFGDKKAAKWINPPESELYQKNKIWFGLNRAKQSIVKTNEAYIVEGYNDVIAFHTNNVDNTIASCGTAITTTQIKILKKYCSIINFVFDDDKAGIKATLKYIPIFITEGFRVNVIYLNKLDPDDFCRKYKNSISKLGLNHILKQKSKDGFGVLINYKIKGKNALDISKGAKELCKIIATVDEDAYSEIYLSWLQKETKLPKPTLKKWINNETEIISVQKNHTILYQYNLPSTVKVPIDDIKDDIKNYGLFMANNKIYLMNGDLENHNFSPVSNFSVEIIQHMNDEKFPMKLLRIKNVYGLEKIFDVPSESINTPMAFDNAVTAHGNFLFNGGRKDFLKLRAFLFDKMGNGRKIDVLGWQPEGFWCWNNLITIPGKKDIVPDNNGIFNFKEISYYLPSANKIYANNVFRYEGQKRFVVKQALVSFKIYTSKMMEVHREHAISGILFSVAALFQDIVVKELGNFPIYYLYGPPSTGKDQLAECMQSFFGVPQTAINLEGGASTLKAKIREFAQFSNSIGHLSEYKRGDANTDGTLKGLWDRRGYKRGNIETHVGTDSIPILSAAILTGNDYPDSESLITRLIWNEMTKNTFNDLDIKRYDELKDMSENGISSFSNEILQHRKLFKDNFRQKYRMFKENLKEKVKDVPSRIIDNLSVLGATHSVLLNEIDFPFSFSDIIDHFEKIAEAQLSKLNSASIINKWWDCFLQSLRGHKDDRLQIKRDFVLEGEKLFFNMTNTYNKVQRQWWTQYHEMAPTKSVISDALKKSKAHLGFDKHKRFESGRLARQTSTIIFNYKEIQISQEIFNAIDWQMSEGTLFDSPTTPKSKNKSENQQDDDNPELLPF